MYKKTLIIINEDRNYSEHQIDIDANYTCKNVVEILQFNKFENYIKIFEDKTIKLPSKDQKYLKLNDKISINSEEKILALVFKVKSLKDVLISFDSYDNEYNIEFGIYKSEMNKNFNCLGRSCLFNKIYISSNGNTLAIDIPKNVFNEEIDANDDNEQTNSENQNYSTDLIQRKLIFKKVDGTNRLDADLSPSNTCRELIKTFLDMDTLDDSFKSCIRISEGGRCLNLGDHFGSDSSVQIVVEKGIEPTIKDIVNFIKVKYDLSDNAVVKFGVAKNQLHKNFSNLVRNCIFDKIYVGNKMIPIPTLKRFNIAH